MISTIELQFPHHGSEILRVKSTMALVSAFTNKQSALTQTKYLHLFIRSREIADCSAVPHHCRYNKPIYSVFRLGTYPPYSFLRLTSTSSTTMQFTIFPFLLPFSFFSYVLTTPLGGDQKRAAELDISNDFTTRNRTIQLEGLVSLVS